MSMSSDEGFLSSVDFLFFFFSKIFGSKICKIWSKTARKCRYSDCEQEKVGVGVFFLAHLAFRPCELLSSLFVCRPSVNISHFNLLLRNHWANCNQTLVEWSLDGPLPNLCPMILTSNQDGRQAKNRYFVKWPKLLYFKPECAQI